MGLVPYLLENMQGHPFFIQPAGEHLPGQVDLLLAFGKRYDRDFKPQLLQRTNFYEGGR